MSIQKWFRSLTVLMLAVLALLPTVVQAQDTSDLRPAPARAGSRLAETVTLADGVTIAPQSRTANLPREAVALTHSTSQEIVLGVSTSCVTKTGNYTRENSFYRTFTLSEFDITQPLVISSIEIGVDLSDPGVGADYQPLSVNLYVLDGAFVLANLTKIGGASYLIPEFELGYLDLPVNGIVFPDETLVVEIFVPEGALAGHVFFYGANSAGQSAPSYLRAPVEGCDLLEPTDMATVGESDVHWVLNVIGDTAETTDYELLTDGSFETDVNTDKQPDTWTGANLTKDKLKTNTVDKEFAFDGENAFLFKASDTENSSLKQVISMAPYPVAADDTLVFSTAVNGKNLSAGARVKVIVTYTDTGLDKDKLVLPIPTDTYPYETLTTDPLTTAGAVNKVKVVVQNKATTGKFYIDASSLIWTPAAVAKAKASRGVQSAAAQGLIPLPSDK